MGLVRSSELALAQSNCLRDITGSAKVSVQCRESEEQVLFLLFLWGGSTPQHMEVLRLGVELELQLPAYTTASAKGDPSHSCNLQHSSQQHWIVDPLSGARDKTRILMDTNGNSQILSYFKMHHRAT